MSTEASIGLAVYGLLSFFLGVFVGRSGTTQLVAVKPTAGAQWHPPPDAMLSQIVELPPDGPLYGRWERSIGKWCAVTEAEELPDGRLWQRTRYKADCYKEVEYTLEPGQWKRIR